MQAAIYFQILEDTTYKYDKPLLNALKQHLPDLLTFDFDTQSDRIVAGYATDLLDKADEAVVILELQDGPATGLIPLLEKVIAYKNKCMVLLYGQHSVAERMLKLLDEDKLVQVQGEEEALQQAIHFLAANRS